jgi:hypothetical protein
MTHFHLTHNSSRNCVRCGLDLTDAASMEAGIGPICRKLDNKLLAQQIAANVGLAQQYISNVNGEELAAESHPTFSKVIEDIYSAATNDWRTTVKRIEWMLSFPQNVVAAKVALTNAVAALGYVGLASLWNGEASTGATTVFLNGNRLHVVGPRNKPFRIAIKQHGGYFHAAVNGAKASWSLPVAKWAVFKGLVQQYYPNHDAAELDGVIKAATATVTSAHTTVAPLKVPNMSNVRVEANGEWINVFTPYNQQFVNDIKAMPVGTRKWNPVAKCWEVHASHAAALNSVVGKHFKGAPQAAMPEAVVLPSVDDVMPF